jgi:regulator of protease activity HflC (stomatin/prohibitin superfamily)
MHPLITFLVIVVSLILLFLFLGARRFIVFEFERAILFKRGKYHHTLEPGTHWYLTPIHTIRKMDMRSRSIPIPGQEVLSSDNIGIKISLIGTYKIDDPVKATIEVNDCHQATYLELQVNLRDVVGAIPIDEFLSRRQDIGKQIFERSKDSLSKFGVLLEDVSIKDIMFPGDLKQIFAQVVNARNEGLAALERARGESAALRNLANAASAFEKNPGLLQLRTLQAIERSPGNIILSGDFFEIAPQAKMTGKSQRKE